MDYRHLTIDERESILKMRLEQKNITHIAELLRCVGSVGVQRVYGTNQTPPNFTLLF